MVIEKNIILFDGVCNLCNGFVRWIFKYDKNQQFVFCKLQSAKGQEILLSYSLDNDIKTVVLISRNHSYIKSDAVLQILSLLRFPKFVLIVFSIIPKVFRDKLYDFIAKYRYKIFGYKEVCVLPINRFKERFLD